MSEAWTWTFETADGAPVTPASAPDGAFETQADAEAWVGENYQVLAEQGADAVRLLKDGEQVYGPMSLHPMEG